MSALSTFEQVELQKKLDQSSKEIELMNALVAMQAEALKDARASFLGLQPDFGGPISAQMGNAIERINTTLSASSETVEAWKAKMLEPLQRQVAIAKSALLHVDGYLPIDSTLREH